MTTTLAEGDTLAVSPNIINEYRLTRDGVNEILLTIVKWWCGTGNGESVQLDELTPISMSLVTACSAFLWRRQRTETDTDFLLSAKTWTAISQEEFVSC